jgi:hypothetical protein
LFLAKIPKFPDIIYDLETAGRLILFCECGSVTADLDIVLFFLA